MGILKQRGPAEKEGSAGPKKKKESGVDESGATAMGKSGKRAAEMIERKGALNRGRGGKY